MKTKSKLQDLLDSVIDDGFDDSYITEAGGVRVRCSQCQALVINGHATHEHGCPNIPRTAQDDADWEWEQGEL